MSHQVLKVTNERLHKMKKHYISSLKSPTPQNAAFAAKVPGCTITAYTSGKVLFQGADASREAGIWEGSPTEAKKKTATSAKKSVDTHNYSPPAQLQSLAMLGSDEAGTGDYFGPITVACTYLTPEQMKNVEHMGIRDSKTIKDPVILELAPEIMKKSTYSLLTLSNEKYNNLQVKGYNQGRMKAMMHHQAIMNVLNKCREQKLNPEGVFVDQFCQPGVYFNYLKQSGHYWQEETPIYFATKAESLHVSVAAASVIARYAFVREMDKLETSLGSPVPKGASGKVDSAAAEIIRLHGRETLKQCAKLHFANTGKAERLV